MEIRCKIYRCVDPGGRFNWNFILGLVGILLLNGCQSIPSDLMKTFPEESTQYIYDFPVQLGLEWWYQGRVLEDGQEESYVNQNTVSQVDGLGEGSFMFSVKTSNQNNLGSRESHYQMDSTGIIFLGSEPGTSLERQLVPHPFLQFPIVLGNHMIQIDKKDLDLGVDLDQDGENERIDVHGKIFYVTKESVTVPAGTYSDAIVIETQMISEIHLSTNKKTFPSVFFARSWQDRDTGMVKLESRTEVFLALVQLGDNKVIKIQEELVGVRPNSQFQ